MQIDQGVPLAPKTTFCIGGAARFFARVQTTEELKDALAFARENARVFILGGGSNVLVGSSGFDGLVVKIEFSGVDVREAGGGAELVAAAGESWDGVVERAVKENLWGLENLSGIPGTVGGAVVQNIGAYGAALSQTLVCADAFEVESGEVRRFSRAECRFDYRDSIFKQQRGRSIVLRAAFALSQEPMPNLSYVDLARRFEGKVPTLSETREAVLSIRKGKFPDLAVEGTAGSFFKNPILEAADAEKLHERYPDMPLFAMPETKGVKVPLAYLLDRGLGLKNLSVGGARLFEHQPLVIAAKRGTPPCDVEALARTVAEKIASAYAIEIEPEVVIV